VLFNPQNQLDFVIRELAVDGETDFAGAKLEFLGLARGLTTQPTVLGQPAVLQIQTRGAAEMAVAAVFDHTGPIAQHRVAIDCPRLAQPQLVLGQPDQFAVVVAPSTAHLRMVMDVTGDALSGQIVLEQPVIAITPKLAPRYGAQQLAGRLQEALARVKSIHSSIELSGTLKNPRCKMRSNLGPQLAQGLEEAFQRELLYRRDQLVQHADRAIQSQLSVYAQTLADKQRGVFERLEVGDHEVQQLKQQIAARVSLPNGMLDENLRLGDLPIQNLPRNALPEALPWRR
jgi:uncharacterized protein (TIGR03545 family)